MPDYTDYDFERRAHAERGSVVLDFGKHEGEAIGDIPAHYPPSWPNKSSRRGNNCIKSTDWTRKSSGVDTAEADNA